MCLESFNVRCYVSSTFVYIPVLSTFLGDGATIKKFPEFSQSLLIAVFSNTEDPQSANQEFTMHSRVDPKPSG